ncbi:hypothetical protein BU15DRAFT_59901 [Melanogaster broomeanus]|nr:hypothetical protein BU15DRAFT_59901 [Melanogaster broomeanus]
MITFDFAKVLKHSFVALTAGASLSLIIFAILTGQVGLYFWRRSIHGCDPLWIKGIVRTVKELPGVSLKSSIYFQIVCIWVVQALEVARKGCRSTEIVFVLTYMGQAMTAFLVHSLFVRRIFLLGKILETIKIPIVLILVVVLEACKGQSWFSPVIIADPETAFGVVSFVSVIKFEYQEIPLPWEIPVWLGFSITADILIAGSLYYILKKNRSGLARTDRMIKRLMSFVVQTGLITSVAAGVTVAIVGPRNFRRKYELTHKVKWAVAKLDIDHLWMSFPMGGIYATCLMANYIARESYLHPRVAYEDIELAISRGSMVFAPPENFAKNSPEPLEPSASDRPSETSTLNDSSDGSAIAVKL